MDNVSARRRHLLKLVGLGALGPAGLSGLVSTALARGAADAAQGIQSVRGEVRVNGERATRGTLVLPGDRVETGAGSQAVMVIGKDAVLLRAGSNVVFEADDSAPGVLSTIAIASGKVLSVFGKRLGAQPGVQVRTPSGLVGIRGTGVYIEVHEGCSHVCLCYGVAAIRGKGMDTPYVYQSIHHDQPLLLDDRSGTLVISKAHMLPHTDEELILLESLFNREPPFVALGLTGKY
jgi:hypothetical protein